MGRDWWSYGVGANRATLDAFLAHHHDQGLSQRNVAPAQFTRGDILQFALDGTPLDSGDRRVYLERGYGGVRAWTSFSVMAPGRVPPAIVKRLGEEVSKALRNPAVIQRLEQQALIPVHDTPEEFASEIRKEREHWAQFIRRNNVTAD